MKILRCFCGGQGIEIIDDSGSHGQGGKDYEYYIECKNCGLRGPSENDYGKDLEANPIHIIKWNNCMTKQI